jgi:hypothetical protein
VIRNRIRRLTTVVTTAVLSLLLLGVGTSAAGQPNWSFSKLTPLPGTVKAGESAGYLVEITNGGPSNIKTLFLTSNPASNTTYVGLPSQGSCDAVGGPLKCSFGTVRSGAANAVSVIVAFATPSSGTPSPFAMEFLASTNGAPLSDGGASHGDFLRQTATTILSTSDDYAGGFATALAEIATGGLSSTNIQQTKVNANKIGIVVTAEDGLADTAYSCGDSNDNSPECANRFGQWSRINVENGAPQAAFKVTLVIAGSSVPAGATTLNIDVIHVDEVTGVAYEISARCNPTTGTPNNPECVTVTRVGANFQIVVWLLENGGVRGTF